MVMTSQGGLFDDDDDDSSNRLLLAWHSLGNATGEGSSPSSSSSSSSQGCIVVSECSLELEANATHWKGNESKRGRRRK